MDASESGDLRKRADGVRPRGLSWRRLSPSRGASWGTFRSLHEMKVSCLGLLRYRGERLRPLVCGFRSSACYRGGGAWGGGERLRSRPRGRSVGGGGEPRNESMDVGRVVAMLAQSRPGKDCAHKCWTPSITSMRKKTAVAKGKGAQVGRCPRVLSTMVATLSR